MFAEAAGVKRIIIACGRTDLRKGIDGLSQIIGTKYDMNPFEKDVLFLFCGGRGDRNQRVGGADKKLDSLRAPKGAESACIHKTKLMSL